jgi:hypothetical protein
MKHLQRDVLSERHEIPDKGSKLHNKTNCCPSTQLHDRRHCSGFPAARSKARFRCHSMIRHIARKTYSRPVVRAAHFNTLVLQGVISKGGNVKETKAKNAAKAPEVTSSDLVKQLASTFTVNKAQRILKEASNKKPLDAALSREFLANTVKSANNIKVASTATPDHYL